MDGFVLVLLIILGAICAAIAASKGRNAVGWFFVGFAAGLIGLILILCMSNLKTEEQQRTQMQSEQHRLREQLRQERMKTETFRRYALDRLDTHDQLLGTDTRTRAALPGQETPQQALPNTEIFTAPQVDANAAVWYYHLNGQTVGPVTQNQIRGLLQARTIDGMTLLWSEDLGQWTAAAQVEPFRNAVYS